MRSWRFSVELRRGFAPLPDGGAEMSFGWIERVTGKTLAWRPYWVCTRGGRNVYAVSFEDGTEGAYFLDFENERLEEF